MGLSPMLWGKEAWRFIHYVALAYEPSEKNKVEYLKFFQDLPNILPCPICGEHFKENMQMHPINLNSKEELFNWTVDMHNFVNLANNKKIYTYDDALKDLNPKKKYKLEDFSKGAALSLSALTLVMLVTKTIYRK